jgi:hypothetical protein
MYDKDNFFEHYFNWVGYPHNTEAGLVSHRWCAISLLAALLGRQFTLPFGHFALLPNKYIQIIGVPATRKSTAIKMSKKLLEAYGYSSFAPEKISLEKFLIELHDLTWGIEDEVESTDDFALERNIFGTNNPKQAAADMDIAEMYIASDEFVDFIGRNNLDFISLLGTFWDYNGVYDRKLKHSKAVYINNPTINIIAGNTHEGFNAAFPPEIQGQGFFSRLLLIHAEPTGRKITFPEPPKLEHTASVLEYMQRIKQTCVGTASITDEAKVLCDRIYMGWNPLPDKRFEHYSGRRFSHLLKLSIICAASRVSKIIDAKDIIMANTLLTYVEYSMPKAMGEFGKGRNSAVSHKILELITNADEPVSLHEIIKHVHSDLDNLNALNDLMNGLRMADKIQVMEGGKFLPKRQQRIIMDSELVKPSWLHPEETKLH